MMAPEYLLDDHGRPLKICGFAALFDTPIEIDGKIETFASGAFSPTLRRGAPAVRALVEHRRDREAWASVRDGSLRLWEDSTGLGFSAMIRNTIDGRAMARAVAEGRAGVSFQCRPLKTEETASGYVIKAAMLTEISLIGTPAYPTAAWLSDPGLMDPMPDHALSLRRRWKEPRHDTTTTLRKMARRVAARKPVPARAVTSRLQSRAVAKRRPPVKLAVSDYYPAIPGLSSEELEEAAFHDAYRRHLNKEQEAKNFARQRERNRAIREARPV